MKQSTLECLKPCARGGSRQPHLFGDFRYSLTLEEVFPKECLFLLRQLAQGLHQPIHARVVLPRALGDNRLCPQELHTSNPTLARDLMAYGLALHRYMQKCHKGPLLRIKSGDILPNSDDSLLHRILGGIMAVAGL